MSEKEVKKIGQGISTSLSRWRDNVKEGKSILDDLKGRLYEKDEKSIKEEREEFDVETCDLCSRLDEILVALTEIVSELKESHEKSVGVEQLRNLSMSMNSTARSSTNSSLSVPQIMEFPSCLLTTSDLVSWSSSLVSGYSSQLSMNRTVVRTFCHLKNKEEALFLTSVWLLQPGLDSQAQEAEFCISQIIKETS